LAGDETGADLLASEHKRRAQRPESYNNDRNDPAADQRDNNGILKNGLALLHARRRLAPSGNYDVDGALTIYCSLNC
jgi:hypothetical protein